MRIGYLPLILGILVSSSFAKDQPNSSPKCRIWSEPSAGDPGQEVTVRWSAKGDPSLFTFEIGDKKFHGLNGTQKIKLKEPGRHVFGGGADNEDLCLAQAWIGPLPKTSGLAKITIKEHSKSLPNKMNLVLSVSLEQGSCGEKFYIQDYDDEYQSSSSLVENANVGRSGNGYFESNGLCDLTFYLQSGPANGSFVKILRAYDSTSKGPGEKLGAILVQNPLEKVP